MYGQAMPFMLVLAFINLGIYYMLEKHAIMKFYKKPPNYMIEINKEFAGALMFAPIGYFAFGFWMYSNRQMLANETREISIPEDVFITAHYFLDCLFYDLTAGHVFLVFLIIALAFQFNRFQ